MFVAAYAAANICNTEGSSSSQISTKQAVQQGLAALVAAGCLQELLLADTGMTQEDLAAIFCPRSNGCGHDDDCFNSSSSSSGQQLQRLDVHNNRLLARGDQLHVGKCLQRLQVGACSAQLLYALHCTLKSNSVMRLATATVETSSEYC
jgi:hypothetical protein